MRFEIVTAYIMGIALPVLEVLRRRTNFDTIAGYVDDFIMGGGCCSMRRAVPRDPELWHFIHIDFPPWLTEGIPRVRSNRWLENTFNARGSVSVASTEM